MSTPSRAQRPAHPSEDEIYCHIENLVALGARRTGSAAGRAAADYVANTMRSLGIPQVQLDEAESTIWDVERTALTIAGQDIDCFPVSHSGAPENYIGPFGTRPEGITTSVVDLEQDHHIGAQQGAIVMFDVRFGSIDVKSLLGDELPPGLDDTKFGELYRALPDGKFRDPYRTTLPDSVSAAIEAGASGFIAVLADYFDSKYYNNEDYGNFDLPGVWVTAAEAARVRQLLAASNSVEATLVMEGSKKKATAFSTVAVLPGRSSETILIHSHHDSVTDGAVEDASGTAAVLGLAQYFSAIPEHQRVRTLMFATMDSHFTGYESHEKFVSDYIERQCEGREILVDVVLEHIARDGRVVDGQLEMSGRPSPRLILTNTGPAVHEILDVAIADLPDIAIVPTALLPGDELPTDAALHSRAGVPVVSLIAAPVYLYDECDTLDKVDRAQLVPVTSAFIDVVEQIALLPKDQIPQP